MIGFAFSIFDKFWGVFLCKLSEYFSAHVSFLFFFFSFSFYCVLVMFKMW